MTVNDCDLIIFNSLVHEVIADVDMLRALVETVVICQFNHTLVVAQEWCGFVDWFMNLRHETA